MTGQNAVSALFRYIHRARSLPRDWTLAGGVSRRVKLFLQKLDWVVQAPFGGIMQLSMWLLTSAGHILLPIVMRSFIIFGKVGDENSEICARKSMMLHGAVWRGYVHLWATYMKLLV